MIITNPRIRFIYKFKFGTKLTFVVKCLFSILTKVSFSPEVIALSSNILDIDSEFENEEFLT